MSNHAIVIVDKGKAEIQEVPIPTFGDDFILVKTHALALNPTDWKHIDYLPSPGSRVGCDYAGTVLEVGSKVTKDFKKGDRVAGVVHGSNAVAHEDGCFQEVIRARGDVQMKIPDNLSFEEASTLGVGITTVGQALYQSLGFPLPESGTTKNDYLLIYGGSTATGALAIQFAKLSGLHVIVTCSAHNFDYVKSIGADAAFDYKSPTCAKDIKEYTKDGLKYAFDCISEGTSTQISVEAMSSSGGVYSNLLSVTNENVHSVNDKVQNKATLAYTMFGQPFKMGPTEIPVVPGNWEFGVKFWNLSQKLLAEGKVTVHKPAVNKEGSGLEGVMKGLDLLRQGKVSGEKLVYTL
ncbi:hypothetical protein B7463_g6920, partial [Scytalidium lignicola]